MFAVFLARPSPFYILDEVEAALDDANIDRFLQLVDRFSDRAQFIIVTHQKRTMDAAHVLYGVSMGAGGVTKVVSRKFEAGLEQPALGDDARSGIGPDISRAIRVFVRGRLTHLRTNPYSTYDVRTMDMRAKVTSKGQVTIPKAVRDALGVDIGDEVLFRVVEGHAVLARTPDFLDLAGAVEVPPELRGKSWQEIRAIADATWVERWRPDQ